MENNLKFRYYPTEDLLINRIDKKLNKEERMVRRYIMNYIIDNDQVFNLEKAKDDMSMYMGFSEEELRVLFNSLKNKRTIVTDEDENVNFIYPVSAISTNHKVNLTDGRKFSAMCAIDSMGTAFTFNQDIKVESVCSNSGKPINIEIKDGRLVEYNNEDIHVLHVDLNKNSNWSGSC
jgi:alkylmercury lyase-like protein